jgi:hypothetical protein
VEIPELENQIPDGNLVAVARIFNRDLRQFSTAIRTNLTEEIVVFPVTHIIDLVGVLRNNHRSKSLEECYECYILQRHGLTVLVQMAAAAGEEQNKEPDAL